MSKDFRAFQDVLKEFKWFPKDSWGFQKITWDSPRNFKRFHDGFAVPTFIPLRIVPNFEILVTFKLMF